MRVLLIDPDDVARAGLRTILTGDERFDVVEDTAREGPSVAQRLAPDLIVLDPSTGAQVDKLLIAAIVARAPQSRLCIYTLIQEPEAIIDLVLCGVDGYLLKQHLTSAALCHALFAIGGLGALTIDRAIVVAARQRLVSIVRMVTIPTAAPMLSDRERCVLDLLASGTSDKAIAVELGVARTTVGTYVDRLRHKLGAEHRAHLIAIAFQQGLLQG